MYPSSKNTLHPIPSSQESRGLLQELWCSKGCVSDGNQFGRSMVWFAVTPKMCMLRSNHIHTLLWKPSGSEFALALRDSRTAQGFMQSRTAVLACGDLGIWLMSGRWCVLLSGSSKGSPLFAAHAAFSFPPVYSRPFRACAPV